MKAKITDSFISKLKPAENNYAVCDTDIMGFRVTVRSSGIKSFIYTYRNGEGVKKTYTIGKYGTLTVSEAREQAKRKAAEVSVGIDLQAEKKNRCAQASRERQQTLGVFYSEKYEPFLLERLKSGREIGQQLKKHFVTKWSDKPLTSINSFLVTAWCNEKLKHGLSNGGINRPVTYLKAMLSRAVQWEIIEKNPLSAFKNLKEDRKGKIRFLSKQEETSLIAALEDRQKLQIKERLSHIEWCKQRDRNTAEPLIGVYTDYLMPLVLLALNTGLRRGELFNLRWGDVNMSRRVLTIHGRDAKSGSTRHVPLNPKAFLILSAWENQGKDNSLNDLIFKSPVTGKRFNNIQSAWEKLIKDASIKDFRFHDLRHTFASKLVMSGVDIYTIKELLGHSNIEMTQRYAHVSFDHKAKAVSLL